MDLNKDFGGYEVEHEAKYIGLLNVGHNVRVASFTGFQTEEFKLEQAMFLAMAGNNYQEAVELLRDLVDAHDKGMNKKQLQSKIELAKKFLAKSNKS